MKFSTTEPNQIFSIKYHCENSHFFASRLHLGCGKIKEESKVMKSDRQGGSLFPYPFNLYVPEIKYQNTHRVRNLAVVDSK